MSVPSRRRGRTVYTDVDEGIRLGCGGATTAAQLLRSVLLPKAVTRVRRCCQNRRLVCIGRLHPMPSPLLTYWKAHPSPSPAPVPFIPSCVLTVRCGSNVSAIQFCLIQFLQLFRDRVSGADGVILRGFNSMRSVGAMAWHAACRPGGQPIALWWDRRSLWIEPGYCFPPSMQ